MGKEGSIKLKPSSNNKYPKSKTKGNTYHNNNNTMVEIRIKQLDSIVVGVTILVEKEKDFRILIKVFLHVTQRVSCSNSFNSNNITSIFCTTKSPNKQGLKKTEIEIIITRK